MPFSDPILGGDFLVRPAMKSPNYSAGVSGWSINKDGTVEFNSGVFRGSVQIGTSPGQHIVLANPATGDAVDVYDSGNNLVYNITNTGLAASFYRGGGVNANTSVEMGAGQLIFDRVTFGAHPTSIVYEPDTAGGQVSADLHMQVPSYGVGETLIVDFLSGSFDGTKSATILASQRGGVSGSLLQADQTRTNNLRHYGEYSVTTDASGTFTFNHGCTFTPTGSLWHVATLGDPIMGYMFSYTSTQAIGRAFNGGSGANTASATFNIHAEFFG